MFLNIRITIISKILLMMAFGLTFTSLSLAQIYAPEGLNMPGSWDNWSNPPQNLVFAGSAETAGGQVLLVPLGNPIYQSVFSVAGDVNAGEYQFKFTSGPLSSIWQNQWGGVNVIPNTIQEYFYGVASPDEPAPNNISLSNNKWFVANWDNVGYQNTRALFMEMSQQPVSLTTVTQSPLLPSATDQVVVNIEASAAPSPEEHVFLRYTTNQWMDSHLVEVDFVDHMGSAIIPPFADGTDVNYYIFSTTFENPSADFDLITIHFNNNEGDNFQYSVGDSLSCGSALALISTQPAFPLENSEVIITFNAELGNGGLAGFTDDVYAHTGVITNLSTGTSDWKYVKTAWGANTPETKLTRLQDDLYELVIPNVRDYYGVPASEEILNLAFVFRSDLPVSGTSYLEAKTVDNQDILTPIYSDELNVKITYPSSAEPLVNPNSMIPVCVASLQADSIRLFMDADYLASSQDENLLYGLNTTALASGTHWLIAHAFAASEEVIDSVMIFIRAEVVVENLPDGVEAGINYLDNQSVTLVLYDPAKLKDFAFVIGDFNDWKTSESGYMKRTPDGEYFWITIGNLNPGTEYAYQYYVDGELKLADPFSDKILDPWNDKYITEATYPNLMDYPQGKTTGIVSVLQTGQQDYNWQVTNFTPSAIHASQSNLIIYELLIRDFVGDRKIASVKDSLFYLKNLGVNAIELMPIQEFEGNDSWGYNPSFYFAPDKAYGTKNDYKAFIDACHQMGIAVIMDVVYNHSFGQSPMVQMYWNSTNEAPSAQNPWYNTIATHPYSPGYDFNHESPYTRAFVKRSLQYWMDEYKVDGFRFDLSKGFTQTNSGQDVGYWNQYDQSRINILNDYNSFIKEVNPDSYLILEHLGNNDEETALANAGMLLWGKMNEEFNQATMGWQDNSSFNWAYYNERGFTYPNLIPFMESHDEERLMYRNLEFGNSSGDYDIQESATALSRISAVAPLYFMVPGPKMIWQFGELGYDYSINYCYNGTISEDCRTSAKPVRWDYFNEPERQDIYQTFAAMAQLKTTHEAFISGTFGKDVGGLVKRAWVSHSSLNICAGSNFDVVSKTVTPDFQHTGTWYNYFTGESLQVNSGQSLELGAGEFYVFTDQDLGRPFVHLTIRVLREEDQTPIHGAQVFLEEMGAGFTNTDGEIQFAPFSNQSYSCKVSVVNQASFSGNISITEEDQIYTVLLKNVDAVSLEETKEVKLYPNPAKDQINLEQAAGFELFIYSLQGQLLYQEKIEKDQASISVKHLEAGVYMVYLKNENNFVSDKLIIQ